MKKSRLAALAASLALGMTGMSTVHAGFVLQLDDLSTAGIDVIVSDNDAVDGDGALGIMSYLGGVGSFTVSVTTAESKPALGGGVMQLNAVNLANTAGSTLVVALTDTGFSGSYPSYRANYRGTINDLGLTPVTVDFDFLHAVGEVEFGGTSIINTDPPLSGPAFSGSGVGSITGGSPYSLTIFASIFHGDAGQITSFDAELRPVPLPPVALLFCSGLLGLFGIARLKKSISGNHALSA